MRRSGKIVLGLLTIGALVGTAYASWTINDKFNRLEQEDDTTVVETIDHAEIGKIIVTPKGEKIKFDGEKRGESQLKRTFNITVDKKTIPSGKTLADVYTPSNYEHFADEYIPNIYVKVEAIDASTKEVLSENAEFFTYVTKPKDDKISYTSWLDANCGQVLEGQENPKGFDYTYEFTYKDNINPEDRLNAASDPVKQMEHIIEVLKGVSFKYTFQVGNHNDYTADETGKITMPEVSEQADFEIDTLQNGKLPVGLQKMKLTLKDETVDLKNKEIIVHETDEAGKTTDHHVKAVESKLKGAQPEATIYTFNFNFKKGYTYTFSYDFVKFATFTKDSAPEMKDLDINVTKDGAYEGDEVVFDIVYDEATTKLVEGSVKVNGQTATHVEGKTYKFTLLPGENLVKFAVSEIIPTTYTYEKPANGEIHIERKGDVVTLTNTPDYGYILKHYTVDETNYSASDKPVEVTLTAEKDNVITGEFVPTLTITHSLNPTTIEQGQTSVYTVEVKNSGNTDFTGIVRVRNQDTNQDGSLTYTNCKVNGKAATPLKPETGVPGFNLELTIKVNETAKITVDVTSNTIAQYKFKTTAEDLATSDTINLDVTKKTEVAETAILMKDVLAKPTGESVEVIAKVGFKFNPKDNHLRNAFLYDETGYITMFEYNGIDKLEVGETYRIFAQTSEHKGVKQLNVNYTDTKLCDTKTIGDFNEIFPAEELTQELILNPTPKHVIFEAVGVEYQTVKFGSTTRTLKLEGCDTDIVANLHYKVDGFVFGSYEDKTTKTTILPLKVERAYDAPTSITCLNNSLLLGTENTAGLSLSYKVEPFETADQNPELVYEITKGSELITIQNNVVTAKPEKKLGEATVIVTIKGTQVSTTLTIKVVEGNPLTDKIDEIIYKGGSATKVGDTTTYTVAPVVGGEFDITSEHINSNADYNPKINSSGEFQLYAENSMTFAQKANSENVLHTIKLSGMSINSKYDGLLKVTSATSADGTLLTAGQLKTINTATIYEISKGKIITVTFNSTINLKSITITNTAAGQFKFKETTIDYLGK